MIVICFPGGAGGHFIGYVVNSLITQTDVIKSPPENFHQAFRPDQSFLNYKLLNETLESKNEELGHINLIRPTSKIVLGHFRNSKEIIKKYSAKIILVSIDPNDIDLLVNRILAEVVSVKFNNNIYRAMRGPSWPEVNPGFSQLPEWIISEIKLLLKQMFVSWNDQLEYNDSDDICHLTTRDIFYGDIVNKITNYLQTDTIPSLVELHTSYKQLITNKYL